MPQMETGYSIQILELALFAIVQFNDVRAFQDEKLCQLIFWKQQKKFPKAFDYLIKDLNYLWEEHRKFNDLLPIMADVKALYRN